MRAAKKNRLQDVASKWTKDEQTNNWQTILFET